MQYNFVVTFFKGKKKRRKLLSGPAGFVLGAEAFLGCRNLMWLCSFNSLIAVVCF